MKNYKFAAYDLFSSMRQSTSAEQKNYDKMLEKYFIPFGRSIWSMDEFEEGYCDICHQRKQLIRDYYYYNINCECCGGALHFEIVRHCQDCKSKPPKRISAIVKPVESTCNINPEHWEYYE